MASTAPGQAARSHARSMRSTGSNCTHSAAPHITPANRHAAPLRHRASFSARARGCKACSGPAKARDQLHEIDLPVCPVLPKLCFRCERTVVPEIRAFKSVEHKFSPASPAQRLQGVWLVSNLKQERSEFEFAFNSLDTTKVHFAVLGDFEPEAHVLVRRTEDRRFILDTFQATEASNHTFERRALG